MSSPAPAERATERKTGRTVAAHTTAHRLEFAMREIELTYPDVSWSKLRAEVDRAIEVLTR